MATVVYDGISVERARTILNEARNGGFSDSALPETDEEIIEEAQYWISEAQKAYEAGMRQDTVVAICQLASGEGAQEQEVEAPSEPAPSVDSASAPSPAITDDERSAKERKHDDEALAEIEAKTAEEEVRETYPRRSSGGLSESDERETENVVATERRQLDILAGHEGLPVPKDWEADPRDMPRDLTPLSDIEIRSLHGEYNAYLARARWLLVVEKADLRNASILRDEALRQATLQVDRIDAETKKAKTISLMEAEAMEDKTYKTYAGHASAHQVRVDAFTTLVEIYSGNVSTLSREWTMRQDEWNKSR
jgi:hypothetical protein